MFNFKSALMAVILDDSGMCAYEFKIKNNQLEFIKKYEVDLSDSFHFKEAVFIIDTKDVISKKVLSSSAGDALVEAFPAIRASEVYYDYQNVIEPIISIIKKSALEEIIKRHELNTKFPSTLRLGKTLATIQEGSKELNQQELAEYALGLHIKNIKGDYNFSDLTLEFKNQLFNKRFFEITKWSAILVFLLGLMINFFYHERYRKELEEIRVSAQSFKNIDDKIQSLKQSVDVKTALVNSDNTADVNTLRNIHRLIMLEESIGFTNIEYQPLKSTLQANQDLRIRTDQIIIKGTAKEKSVLDKYLMTLKKDDFIKEMSVVSIIESTSSIQFELLLKLHEVR